MSQTVRLGIDVACRAAHQASLADEAGELVWSGPRFETTPAELEALWQQVPAEAEVMVVMEPTRVGAAGGLVGRARRDGGVGAA